VGLRKHSATFGNVYGSVRHQYNMLREHGGGGREGNNWIANTVESFYPKFCVWKMPVSIRVCRKSISKTYFLNWKTLKYFKTFTSFVRTYVNYTQNDIFTRPFHRSLAATSGSFLPVTYVVVSPGPDCSSVVPCTVHVRYTHAHVTLPTDVRVCVRTWTGFETQLQYRGTKGVRPSLRRRPVQFWGGLPRFPATADSLPKSSRPYLSPFPGQTRNSKTTRLRVHNGSRSGFRCFRFASN